MSEFPFAAGERVTVYPLLDGTGYLVSVADRPMLWVPVIVDPGRVKLSELRAGRPATLADLFTSVVAVSEASPDGS